MNHLILSWISCSSWLSKQRISKIYFRWFSNFYSSSFLRLLAIASKLPSTANPRPASPVLVSASPVFAKRFVACSTLAVGAGLMFSSTFGDVGVGCGLLPSPWSSPLPSGLVGLDGVTFLKICVTTSSLTSVLTNTYYFYSNSG